MKNLALEKEEKISLRPNINLNYFSLLDAYHTSSLKNPNSL